MKKLGICVLACLGALHVTGGVAQAAEVSVGSSFTLERSATSSENTYVVAESAELAGVVAGDALVLTKQFSFSGTTTEDLLFVAHEADLSGTVVGDTRLIAGIARIGGEYGGDLMVVAGSALFQPSFRGTGDTRIYASRIVFQGESAHDLALHGRTIEFNGVVDGDLIVTFRDRLIIGDAARISGSVFYEGPREPRVSEGAQIKGEMDGEIVMRPKRSDVYLAELNDLMTSAGFLLALSSAFASVLVVLLFPRFSRRAVTYALRRGVPAIGYGAMLFVGILLLGTVALFSVLGFYIGLLLLFGLLVVGMLAALLTPALAGALIAGWIVKEQRVTWYWVILGVIALELLILIPLFGPVVRILLYLAVLGSLARGMYDVWWTGRKENNAV